MSGGPNLPVRGWVAKSDAVANRSVQMGAMDTEVRWCLCFTVSLFPSETTVHGYRHASPN